MFSKIDFKILITNKNILIVLFALLIRLIILILAHPWSEPVLMDDDQCYALMGEYILDNGNFAFQNIIPEIYSSIRTPGYPLFITIIYFLFGKHLWLIPLFQVLLDTGTVLLVYFMAMELFKSIAISRITAFLYSISISSIMYTQVLLNETLFVFTFTLSAFLAMKAIHKNNHIYFIIAAIALGTSAYVRPLVIYFPVMLGFILLFVKNISIPRRLSLFLVFITTFFLVISPWQFHNLNKYGHYKMTSIGGYSLYNYNVCIVKSYKFNKSTLEIKKEHLKDVEHISNPFEKSAALQKHAFEFIKNHPLDYAKYHFIGIIRMYLGTSKAFIFKLLGVKDTDVNKNGYKSLTEKIIRNIYAPHEYFLTLILSGINMMLYLFAFFGMYKLWKTKHRNVLLAVLLILIILYLTNITSVIGSLRYKQPIIPFYLIFSSVGLYELYKSIKSKYLAAEE